MDRVYQSALNDDERFLVLFFSILCAAFFLYVQRHAIRRKRTRKSTIW